MGIYPWWAMENLNSRDGIVYSHRPTWPESDLVYVTEPRKTHVCLSHALGHYYVVSPFIILNCLY